MDHNEQTSVYVRGTGRWIKPVSMSGEQVGATPQYYCDKIRIAGVSET